MNSRLLRRLVILPLAVAAIAIPAAPAAAGANGADRTHVQRVTGSSSAVGGSRLPFTDLDIALMLAGGVVLLGGALVLGRLVRRAPDRS